VDQKTEDASVRVSVPCDSGNTSQTTIRHRKSSYSRSCPLIHFNEVARFRMVRYSAVSVAVMLSTPCPAQEAPLPPDRPYVFGYHPHGKVQIFSI
jgi:hypothetical protein